MEQWGLVVKWNGDINMNELKELFTPLGLINLIIEKQGSENTENQAFASFISEEATQNAYKETEGTVITNQVIEIEVLRRQIQPPQPIDPIVYNETVANSQSILNQNELILNDQNILFIANQIKPVQPSQMISNPNQLLQNDQNKLIKINKPKHVPVSKTISKPKQQIQNNQNSQFIQNHPNPVSIFDPTQNFKQLTQIDKTKLFITNISPQATSNELNDLFSTYNPIHCSIPQKQFEEKPNQAHYGFADFTNEVDASHSMSDLDGYKFQGYKLHIEFSNKPKDHPKQLNYFNLNSPIQSSSNQFQQQFHPQQQQLNFPSSQTHQHYQQQYSQQYQQNNSTITLHNLRSKISTEKIFYFFKDFKILSINIQYILGSYNGFVTATVQFKDENTAYNAYLFANNSKLQGNIIAAVPGSETLQLSLVHNQIYHHHHNKQSHHKPKVVQQTKLKSSKKDKRILIIENLSLNTTHETLMKVFSGFDVKDVQIPGNQPENQPRFGFAFFSTKNNAKKAKEGLNGTSIDGSIVKIRKRDSNDQEVNIRKDNNQSQTKVNKQSKPKVINQSQPKVNNKQPQQKQKNNSQSKQQQIPRLSILIENLNPETTESSLMELLAPFKPKNCLIPPNQLQTNLKQALINFSTQNDAKSVISNYNGKEINGSVVKVKYSNSHERSSIKHKMNIQQSDVNDIIEKEDKSIKNEQRQESQKQEQMNNKDEQNDVDYRIWNIFNNNSENNSKVDDENINEINNKQQNLDGYQKILNQQIKEQLQQDDEEDEEDDDDDDDDDEEEEDDDDDDDDSSSSSDSDSEDNQHDLSINYPLDNQIPQEYKFTSPELEDIKFICDQTGISKSGGIAIYLSNDKDIIKAISEYNINITQ